MRPRTRRESLCLSAILAAWAGPSAQAQDPTGVVIGPMMARPAPPPPIPTSPPEAGGHHVKSFFRKLRGRPEEQFRPPLGTDLYAVNNVQVANGDAARMVLHRYDFLDGTGQLNERGKYRVAWIARQLPRVPAPVFVESTPDEPGLDEARQASVELALSASAGSMPLLPGIVRVGRPTSRGFMGIEAEAINLNRVGNLAAKGPPIGSSAGPGPFDGGAAGSTPGFGR